MGNSTSRSRSSKARAAHGPTKHKPTLLSVLSLGCASASQTPDDGSFHTSSHGSTRLGDRDEKLSLEHPPPQYGSTPELTEDDANTAYKAFIKEYPEYQLTWILDTLRRSDFARLDRSGETYVDYMGGSLYPESLIRVHTSFLQRHVLGNTHSVNHSSILSATFAAEAREAVLSFFRAPPGYTVIFTSNATGALKLVGESFPFADGGSYVLSADSHNSVHGIRQFAAARGAEVHYIDAMAQGGVDYDDAKNVLSQHKPPRGTPSLFALTGQSNISNTKNPLSLIQYASSLGYATLLDAAALAPTSMVSLADTPVDAMAVSFYKMFGFPTGVGALIAKDSFLELLSRPWFAGGTVDVVQAPGNIVTMTAELHERFEDGTINYLNLPAITDGLRFLSAYLPFLPLRLSSLTHYLIDQLHALRHEETGTPVARVLSRPPSRRVKAVGEQADAGSTISLIFLAPSGEMLPLSFVEHAATTHNISLRTGCMCNPGGAATLLGLGEDMQKLYPGVTMKQFELHVGHELGVVRMSLGLASNFQDVWRVLQFVEALAKPVEFVEMWTAWAESRSQLSDASTH